MLSVEDRSVLISMRLRPDVIEELSNKYNSLYECINEIVDRLFRGDVVSRQIYIRVIKEGYSYELVRFALNRLSLREVNTLDEAFKGVREARVFCGR